MSQSPPGQVGAADRAREEDVAGEEGPVGGEREMPRRVAGDEEHLERDPGELDRLPAGQLVLGLVRADVHAGRGPLVDVDDQVSIAGGRVHRGAGSLREVGEGADVVPVAVRDEDGDATRAQARERRRISAGSPLGSTTTASSDPTGRTM